MELIKEQIEYLIGLRFPMYRVSYSAKGDPIVTLIEGAATNIPVPERARVREYLLKLYFFATEYPDQFEEFIREIRAKIEERNLANPEEAERARAFNQPHVFADVSVFDQWAQMRHWNLEDALLLLLKRNPDKVTHEQLTDAGTVSAFARKYLELRAVANSHVGGAEAQLSDPVRPAVFLQWAQRYSKPVAAELLSAVQKYEFEVQEQASSLYEKKQSNGIAPMSKRNVRRRFVASIGRGNRGDALRYELAEIMDKMVDEGADPQNIPAVIGRIKASIKDGGVIVSIDEEGLLYMKNQHSILPESITLKTLRERIATLLKLGYAK